MNMKCENCNGTGLLSNDQEQSCFYCGGGGEVNRVPKSFFDFDDAGASDIEPVKGITVGDIRAWHDQHDRLLSSWAECRGLLSKERAITAKAEGILKRHLTDDRP